MGGPNPKFAFEIGDVVRISTFKNGKLHHEFHGLIESKVVKNIPGHGNLPHYKLYSDEFLYPEDRILGRVLILDDRPFRTVQ